MPGAHYFSTGRKTYYPTATLLTLLLASTPAWSVDDAASATTAATPATETIVESTTPATNDTPTGRVARAIFTTAIADREPVDDLTTLPNSTDRVYFFSDLRELAGQIVTHRWEFDGQVMAEVTFKVGEGARWRVYSSKNLLPDWTGTWTVMINNESGQTLQTSTFEYTAAAQ
jgi:hypothetical protein